MNSTPPLIDSHVHTDDDRLTGDRARILAAARRANVVAQVVPGVTANHWSRIRSLCAEHDDLFACYGLHPCHAGVHDDRDLESLAQWLATDRPVAVGECGLDYHVSGADKARQQHLFAAQLALAREFRLPVVIHARKAVEDVIRMVRSSGHYSGMVHSFNGSAQQAGRLIDLGYRLSFGGAATFARARRLRQLFASLPLDALLLETDAPDQPDATRPGERNEPAFLVDVWRQLSQLRDESAEAVAEMTSHNAIELFRLPHSQVSVTARHEPA